MTSEHRTTEHRTTDEQSPSHRLEQARADLVRRADVGARIAQSRDRLAEAREHRAAASARVERESDDVERLAGSTVSGLWSRVRGRRERDVAREQAELDRARADLTEADALVAARRADVDRLLAESEHLVDADAREQSALEDLARGAAAWDGLDPVQVAQARAEVERRRSVRELDLALATGAGLLRSLDVVCSMSAAVYALSVADLTDHAGPWAKYARFDELVPFVQSVNDGIAGFASAAGRLGALAPGRLEPIAVPHVDRRVRQADRWLDDPVSDVLVTTEARRVATSARIVRGTVAEAVTDLRAQRELVPSAPTTTSGDLR